MTDKRRKISLTSAKHFRNLTRLVNSRYFKKVQKTRTRDFERNNEGFPNLNSRVSIVGLLSFLLLPAAYIENRLARKSKLFVAFFCCFNESVIFIEYTLGNLNSDSRSQKYYHQMTVAFDFVDLDTFANYT